MKNAYEMLAINNFAEGDRLGDKIAHVKRVFICDYEFDNVEKAFKDTIAHSSEFENIKSFYNLYFFLKRESHRKNKIKTEISAYEVLGYNPLVIKKLSKPTALKKLGITQRGYNKIYDQSLRTDEFISELAQGW